MQKNERGYEVPLTKQEFVDILNRLREATELVDKVEELFRDSRENLECDFCNGAGLQISHEGIGCEATRKTDAGQCWKYFVFYL